MANLDAKNLKNNVLNKIRFLEDQVTSLNYYLPETYQLLMEEMDQQQRELAKLKIQEFYQKQQDE